MQVNCNIRKASKTDLPKVFELVYELAVFEKMPEAVTATLADYESAFGSELIDIIVAEVSDQIVGIAIYYETFSTWKGKMLYLEDFVIKEAFRRKGIGKRIFDAFLKEAHDRKCNLTKWQVLDWNQGAIDFYKEYGATIQKGWWNCLVYF